MPRIGTGLSIFPRQRRLLHLIRIQKTVPCYLPETVFLVLEKSALLLLMLGVLADHHDLALAANDLALFADRLHRRTNLHVLLPPYGFLGCTGRGNAAPAMRQILSPCCAR